MATDIAKQEQDVGEAHEHLTPTRKPNRRRREPDVVIITRREQERVRPYIFGQEDDDA